MVHHACYDSSLQNQICPSEVRCPRRKRQDAGGERVGRVGQQPERPTWRDEVRQITLDDGGGMIAEVRSQLTRTPRVQFDRDHAGTRLNDRHGESAGAGT